MNRFFFGEMLLTQNECISAEKPQRGLPPSAALLNPVGTLVLARIQTPPRLAEACAVFFDKKGNALIGCHTFHRSRAAGSNEKLRMLKKIFDLYASKGRISSFSFGRTNSPSEPLFGGRSVGLCRTGVGMFHAKATKDTKRRRGLNHR